MKTGPLGEREREKIIHSALSSVEPLKIKVLPVKAAKKRVVLELAAELFEPGADHTQKQVNDLLGGVYADPVALRRELVEAGLLLRTPDGARYWRQGQDS